MELRRYDYIQVLWYYIDTVMQFYLNYLNLKKKNSSK